MKTEYMKEAIRLAIDNVSKGGGPFGAVIVKDGVIVGKGFNRVTHDNDPTAHAEVMAIRDAAKHLNDFNLKGCELYTSCEPCPMCLGAIYWARLDGVYYGTNKRDAAASGFDDDLIYREFEKPLNERNIPFKQLLPEDAMRAFDAWKQLDEKQEY